MTNFNRQIAVLDRKINTFTPLFLKSFFSVGTPDPSVERKLSKFLDKESKILDKQIKVMGLEGWLQKKRKGVKRKNDIGKVK